MRPRSALLFTGVGTLLLAAAVAAAGQGRAYTELRPVDEASQQPVFFTFRARLQAAIARHDAAAVLAVVDPSIRNTFGGDDGRKSFEERWDLSAADSQLWDKLGTVLALGGRFENDRTFSAPYTYSAWPKDLDAMDNVAIIGDQVRVRASPGDDGAVVGAVSFAVLPLAPTRSAPHRGWTAVELSGRRVGYVASQYARSQLDYRAIFSRAGNQWRMAAFVAGD